MKIKSISILIISMLSFGAFSQVKFGVRAGVGLYKVSQSAVNARVVVQNSLDKDVPNNMELIYSKNDGLGYNFGLFIDFPLFGDFNLQIEPSVSLRNYNEVYKQFEVSDLSSIMYESFIYNKLTYLDVPILFKYNFKPNTGRYGRKSYYSFFVGPQIGLFMNNSEDNRLTTTVDIYDQKTTNTENVARVEALEYNTLDLALVAGAMYDFEKGFRFGVRYVGSMMPLNRNINFNIYHHSVQLTLGWNFIEQ